MLCKLLYSVSINRTNLTNNTLSNFDVFFKVYMTIGMFHYYIISTDFRLEVWPGYITSVCENEGGLMLLADASHRVLRTQTVLELM